MNVWINWGKKVKGAQGNSSPFFFIAVNFDKDSTVSLSYFFFPSLEELCAKLHYSSSPWYCHETCLVCLPEKSQVFMEMAFFLQQQLPLSHQAWWKEEQKSTGLTTKHYRTISTTTQTRHPPPSITKTRRHLPKSLFPPPTQPQIHAKHHSPLCTASFLSTLMPGK